MNVESYVSRFRDIKLVHGSSQSSLCSRGLEDDVHRNRRYWLSPMFLSTVGSDAYTSVGQ